MARTAVDEAIQEGLEVWSKVTPLQFTKISKGIADIMIAFRTRGKVFNREQSYFHLWRFEETDLFSSNKLCLSPWSVSSLF